MIRVGAGSARLRRVRDSRLGGSGLGGSRLSRRGGGGTVLLLAQRVEQVVGAGRLLGGLTRLWRAGVEDRFRRLRAVRHHGQQKAGGEEQRLS